MDGAQAVGAGVAAAQDYDVQVPGVDRRRLGVAHGPIRRFEVRHRGVHATKLGPWDRDEPGTRRTQGEQHGVEVALQIAQRRGRVTDAHVGVEGDARGRHHGQATIEDCFF